MTLNVRLSGALGEFVAENVGSTGAYAPRPITGEGLSSWTARLAAHNYGANWWDRP